MYIPESLYFVIDAIVVAIILLCLFIGYKKGFIYQLIDLLSFVLAFLIAWFLSPIFAEHLPLMSSSETLSEVVVGTFINNVGWFLIVLIVCKIIFALIMPIFKFVRSIPVIGTINGIGGLVTGLINGFIWVTVFSLILLTPLFENGAEARANSLIKPVYAAGDYVMNMLAQRVGNDFVQDELDNIDEYREMFEGWLEDNGILNDK